MAFDDYSELKKRMDGRYGKRDPPAAIRRQLQTVRQKVDETLEEFAERVQRLTLDSYEGMVSDDIFQLLAVDAFLEGCKNHHAAGQVRTKEPKSFDEALRLMKLQLTGGRTEIEYVLFPLNTSNKNTLSEQS